MSVIKELIRTEADGTISFGDYSLDAKAKAEDFEHEGDLYKVKTYCDIKNWSGTVCLSMNPYRELPSADFM